MSTSQVVTATLQSTGLSCISNILSQILSAYREQRAFEFDPGQLFRFALLSILTAPPNFYWQLFLERTFPGRIRTNQHSYYRPAEALEMEERGLASDMKKDDDDKSEEEERPPLNVRNTATKWFIDCITMGALLNTTAFLVIMGVLKGKAGSEIVASVRTETIPIIIASYKIWPIASVVNFSLIPVEKRIVFLSFIGLLWGIYMSLVAARV